MQLENDLIKRTAFSFGHFLDRRYGTIVLADQGVVKSYSHENEARYIISDNKISFLNVRGEITSTLEKVSSDNFYAQRGFSGLYLAPAVTLDPSKKSAKASKIFVNTVPKAGTYLLEGMLKAAGFFSSKFHLFDDYVVDNRRVDEETMHFRFRDRIISISASTFCHLLQPGEISVGHLCQGDQLRNISRDGISILNCVRDLRNTLVSYYHFLKKKVDPYSSEDRLWRALTGREGFIAFLSARTTEEVAFVQNVAKAILDFNGPHIHFEDLERGTITDEVKGMLDGFEPGLSKVFLSSLQKSFDQPTSTLSAKRADYKEYWDDNIQRYFDEMGLTALNNALGYI